MTIAPQNPYPERVGSRFDRTVAPSIPASRGPLRFEEGIATDTDVPMDFARGAYFDTTSDPARHNHNNPEMLYKHADETMRERAHIGSAAWIEAPGMLSDFVQGAGAGQGMPAYELVRNPLTHRMNRPPANIVRD